MTAPSPFIAHGFATDKANIRVLQAIKPMFGRDGVVPLQMYDELSELSEEFVGRDGSQAWLNLGMAWAAYRPEQREVALQHLLTAKAVIDYTIVTPLPKAAKLMTALCDYYAAQDIK